MELMKINTIKLTNFRSIHEAEICLNGDSAVFFGVNGSGKTSILHAVSIVFSRLVTRIVQNRFRQNIIINSSDVRVGTSQCEVTASLVVDGREYNIGRKLDKKLNRRLVIGRDGIEDFAHGFVEAYKSVYDEVIHHESNMPIFVNYGVNRSVVEIPLRIRKTHVFDPLYAFENAVYSSADFRTFFEWFRNREDLENEVRANDDPHYRDLQLRAVRGAIEKMMPGFSDLCVKRNPLNMKICKDGTYFNIQQLSDGEKCLLALIGDLARRASMANPVLGNPLLSDGIVLIDEIELHLHPSWQRKVITTLRDTFPNLQFLISTHSPQVLSDIPDDMRVYELINTSSQFNIREMKSLRGWDINSILENNMRSSSININTREQISAAYNYVKSGDYVLAEEQVNRLEEMTSNKNADVVRLRFLINRGSKRCCT